MACCKCKDARHQKKTDHTIQINSTLWILLSTSFYILSPPLSLSFYLSLYTHIHTHTHSTSVQMCNGRKLHFFCPILYIYLSLSHTHTDRLYLSHVYSLSLGEGHALLLCRFFPATYICTSHTHTLSHTFSLSLSLSLCVCV